MTTPVQNLFSLSGRCAVVIGGLGKIGFPITEALAEAGARVYVASRKAGEPNARLAQLIARGLDVKGVTLDQSDEKMVLDLLERTSTEFKVPEILVNCAVERPMRHYLDDTPEAWDRSMEINARGLFVTCRAFAKVMAANKGGTIINVASIYGLVAADPSIYEGTDINTEPDYPYTKGGMIMFSKYLASYFGKFGVRVNCIAPGGLFNNQPEPFYSRYIAKVPMRRMATHDDIKGAIVFLASDAAAYVTGCVLPIDGGFTA
jgi:NAD(P)-dependent dehydrogenase (short-subunit alcohol dehydrogenase family)